MVLDLNGYTLQQSGDANYTVGVFITNGTADDDFSQPNLQNVIVKNGTVQNIATAGFFVNKVDDLLLQDLYVLKNGYNGYILCPCGAHRVGGIIYPSNFPQDLPVGVNSQFQNNHILRNVHADFNGGSQDASFSFGAATHGLNIANVNTIVIEDSSFNNNFNSDSTSATNSAAYGANVFNSTNVTINNSTFNSNATISSNLGVVIGLGFEASTAGGFLIQNSTFNGNSSVNGSAYGLDIAGIIAGTFGMLDGEIINCQAHENFAAVEAAGFITNSYNTSFINCSANSNSIINGSTAVINACEGFNLGGGEHSLINCVARNNGGLSGEYTGTNYSYGFLVVYGTFIRFDNCKAVGNGGPSGLAQGFTVVGIDCTIENCESALNAGTLGSYEVNIDPYAYPFSIPSDPTDYAYAVVVSNCTIHGFADFGNTIGIRLNDAKNCIITNNIIQTCAPDGILVTQGVDCGTVNNVIKHNEIQNLFSSASGLAFGTWAIEDDTYTNSPAGPLNTYYDNYAWDYAGTGGLTNYNTGVYMAGGSAPDYIVDWNVPGPTPAPATLSKLSNLNIITATSCAS